ncbi:cell adhesion molecule 1-like [Nematolebias whitei]|uniref:cell adhesion molecule 1-like n=1 Tax=Nematolebias whitei TaxID=451745 RepID=UPI001899D473|nr:cell adhesion molecule 1-like [Nematolebias whitei]
MDAHTTPAPATQTSTETFPTFPGLVTRIGKRDLYNSTEDFAALIGGIVSVVLLIFLCTITVLLWCLSRQKGSYSTNETDEDDDADIEDDESIGSDVALQSKEPLKADKED